MNHFFDPLVALINNLRSSGFTRETDSQLFLVSDDIHHLLDDMMSFNPPKGLFSWGSPPEKSI